MFLSEHISLDELTVTDNSALQAANRDISESQFDKLKALALHCELIRSICGNRPIRIHSGYRSDALNAVTPGSSGTSQHTKCEAIDFDIPGVTVEDTFTELIQAARDAKFKFGQLILEQAENRFGVAKWVHCSVIGTLNPAHVGQAMKMTSKDGVQKWDLIEQFHF
jgi:hypothetical protein